MTDAEDGLNVRIHLARIEGMLTATLARHDQRLDQHEGTLGQHEVRLDAKGKTLARHDERLMDLEEDNAARWGRVLGIAALIVSAGSVLYSIFNP